MEKNGWSWVIVLIVFFALLFYFTGFVNADSQCQLSDPVCFEKETNPKYIASFQVMDTNGAIVESGQWKNSFDLFFNNPGCIYLQPRTQTIFYSNWDKNWYWEPNTDLFGDVCYKLKK